MKKLINPVALAIFLASCMSAPKHLSKAKEKDEKYVAEKTREWFPCTEVRTDTVNTTDTIVDILQLDCPDNEYTTTEGKTVYLPGKKVTVAGKTITNTRYIDRYIEDSAKIYTMLNNAEVQTNMYREDTARVNKENRRLQAKVNKQRATKNWLWVILGIIVAWNVFKVYRKIALR